MPDRNSILIRSAFRKLTIIFIGASAPNPDLLFVLTQKVSKKHLTRPDKSGHPLQREREKGR